MNTGTRVDEKQTSLGCTMGLNVSEVEVGLTNLGLKPNLVRAWLTRILYKRVGSGVGKVTGFQ